MAIALIPSSAGFRPPTAVQDQTDARDDVVYSSLVIANGASNYGKMFVVPQGGNIQELKGSAVVATTQSHQKVHSELTTNLEKAGEFGSGLGDAAVRGISLCLETAPISNAGVYSTYGACPADVIDLGNKGYFQFKVGSKVMAGGPVGSFPSWAGPQGAISTTANVAMNGVLSNGNALLGGRRQRIPIQISRVDIVVGLLGFGNSSAFVGSGAAVAGGQSFLVWCLLNVLLGADVR